MLLRHMRISGKLAIALGSVLVIMLAVCGGVLYEQQVSIGISNSNATATRVMVNVERALGNLNDQNASVRGLILYRQPSYADLYRAAGKRVDTALSEARSAAEADPEILASVDKTIDVFRKWQSEFGKKIIDLAASDEHRDEATGLAATEAAASAFERVKAYTARTVGKASTRAAETQASQVAAYTIVRTTLMAGIVMLALVLGSAWFWLRRTIGTPIVTMTQAMRALAAGDNDVVVPAAGRRDEVGHMAAALQAFKDAAVARRSAESEAAASRDAAMREQARTVALEAAMAKEQGHVVASLADALERLSQGDLAFELERELAPAYEKLRRDFNAAAGGLKETMTLVATSADAIRSGTGEISAAAEDLSRRTEQQAATLEQTAAALEEITVTVGKTAAGAQHAREVVATTKADAEASEAVVRETVSAMAEIERSSRHIGQIIGLIDEIAFQTNLLALNAGVEAARAGDAGRGFAVVASEVRALAQRSAEAAREIKQLVSASDGHVGRGVSLVGQTGEVLAGMLTKIADINAVVRDIAASAQEQAGALREVSTAVSQMDQVTQQNAAMVEETTAASRSLASETSTLAELIERFELGAAGHRNGRRSSRLAA